MKPGRRNRLSLLWKVLGVAGIASVAATGALVARNERTRRAYTPDEVRSRLHERHAEAEDRAELSRMDPAEPRRG